MRLANVEFLFCYRNQKIVKILSRSCSNQGRVVTDLIANYVYVYNLASFVLEVSRRTFLQSCQHVFICKKWSTFLFWKKRYENKRRRSQRRVSSAVVLRKLLKIWESTTPVVENSKTRFFVAHFWGERVMIHVLPRGFMKKTLCSVVSNEETAMLRRGPAFCVGNFFRLQKNDSYSFQGMRISIITTTSIWIDILAHVTAFCNSSNPALRNENGRLKSIGYRLENQNISLRCSLRRIGGSSDPNRPSFSHRPKIFF